MRRRFFYGAAAWAALLGAGAGCDTQAYCFRDCEDQGQTTGTATGAGGEGAGFNVGGGTTGSFTTSDGGGGAGPCTETNGGVEICDDVDNDCNGVVDDILDIDYNAPKSCGTCDTNCYTKLINFEPASITCTPSPNPGMTPGTCNGSCAADYWNLDNNPEDCEYYCVQTSTTDTVCDNKDDDCNGTADEDVDFCTTTNCGSCGNICVVGHGTAACVKSNMNPCSSTNTQCQISACDAGWIDLDGAYATGCEYNCTPTGPELCGDQVDNDCNGLIDGVDPNVVNDPAIGQPCFGDPDGVCGQAAHQGTTACVNGQVTCTGPNVLTENQQQEICNNQDDDCDGLTDDATIDSGASCGVSNIYPCSLGTVQCLAGGTLDCVGDINPGTETCNGVDDNCDGLIDSTGGSPPADSVGACNVPVPPPPMATSPCMAGMKACVGGVVDCVGDVGPTSQTDSCGVDANCDGTLTNQPNLMSDTANCGSCGNNCMAGSVNAIWGCNMGMCQFQGCLPGFVDLDNNQTCEYPCTFVSAQEACNNQDDNCNGQIDEGVVAPSPVQVCGVSPAATRPECTTQVQVQCVSGGWQCTFPAGVCAGGCSANDETCDGLDNDCDGFLNENVPDFGQPCASDDGLPPPGHGACRTLGTKVCNGGSATVCNATPADCNTLPGGCTELCDEIDNDCDGSVDEPFTAKGTNATHFYKPNVIRLASNLFVHQYEASRPTATNLVPGNGNGYWTSAPLGETLDQTRACSETNKIPWFNVTPVEVEQTCIAMGGAICTLQNWKDTCKVAPAAGADCTWGYSPTGAACTSTAVLPPTFNPPYMATDKFCNLGYFDFNTTAMGNQDGLLPTASNRVNNCYANWEGLAMNPTGVGGRAFDITGNLREITFFAAGTYILMGGAFNTNAEAGAACDFDFYAVENDFKFFDTGFRCCFASDPRL